MSLRPIVAATESEAWAKAEEILERTKERVGNRGRVFSINGESSRGSQRLLEYAAKGDVHDKRLWTAVAKATGAAGNSTALVGSYEQVAESLQEYVDLGVGTLLIRGFDPLQDAKDYGHPHHPGARRSAGTQDGLHPCMTRSRPPHLDSRRPFRRQHDDDGNAAGLAPCAGPAVPDTGSRRAARPHHRARPSGRGQRPDRRAPRRRHPARPRGRPAHRDGGAAVRRPGLGLAQTTRVLHALGKGDPSVALICAWTMFIHAAQACVRQLAGGGATRTCSPTA